MSWSRQWTYEGPHPPGHSLCASHRCWQAAHERVFGQKPTVRAVPYGCDMRLVVKHMGAPTVVYGPGRVAEAHGADECVSLAQVRACARVLLTAVQGLLGAQTP